MITEKIECSRCGERFYSQYYGGGSIHHSNETQARSLLSREALEERIRRDNLDADNYCNIKNTTADAQHKIINCNYIWIKDQNEEYAKIYKDFFDRRTRWLNTIVERFPEPVVKHFKHEYRHYVDQNLFLEIDPEELVTCWGADQEVLLGVRDGRHYVIRSDNLGIYPLTGKLEDQTYIKSIRQIETPPDMAEYYTNFKNERRLRNERMRELLCRAAVGGRTVAKEEA
jgi:hypothetical protein